MDSAGDLGSIESILHSVTVRDTRLGRLT